MRRFVIDAFSWQAEKGSSLRDGERGRDEKGKPFFEVAQTT
jgi:hypothetical protein